AAPQGFTGLPPQPPQQLPGGPFAKTVPAKPKRLAGRQSLRNWLATLVTWLEAHARSTFIAAAAAVVIAVTATAVAGLPLVFATTNYFVVAGATTVTLLAGWVLRVTWPATSPPVR